MYSLQTVFLVVVVLYYVITRGFPRLLSWLIVAKYQTEIKIGWISLLRLSFEDVLIKKSGLSIKVERIGATSSLFNQEERKIFAIKVHDVRIEKEVSERRSRGGAGHGQGDVGLSRSDLEDAFAKATTSLTSNQNASMSEVIRVRIPPSVVTLAQFFGVHIMSVSVMFLREKWPECLLHASAEKITLEGATLNQSNIALIGSITGATVQVLQHAWENNSSSGGGGGGGGERRGVQSVGGSQDPSLMECAGSLKLSVEVNAETIAAMENISVQLSQPQVTIRERLLTFLEHKALAATPVVPSPHLPAAVPSYTSPEALLYKYWLFLPLKFQMKIEDIGVKFMNGLGQTALQGTLAAIDLQTHLNREGALENLPALLPDFSTELQVDNTRVQGTHDSLVTLNRFNLQTQFVGDRVNMKSEFRWLHISYDDRDLAVWTTYLSRRRDPPLPHLPPCAVDGQAKERVGASARRSSNNNSRSSGGIASAFLQRYCVGLIMELWDVSCGASVAGSSHGRTSLQHARFSVAVSQWIAQVAGELILESLVSTLGTVKHSVAPAVSSSAAAAAPKRTHVWGTPAYVGLCLVQLSSSGPPPSSSSNSKVVRETLPPLQAEALIDNVQLEWSPELAALLTTLFRYFQQIKSCSRRPRARTQRGVEPQVEESGEVFSNISAKCTNINVFAVSEQKVSIMARVDSLESQKAAGNFKTVISGTKLLRFVPSGTQYSCVKSSEIKGECGQVSEVVVESVNDEVLVTVSDQLHLTWSTTTHMTLLTLGQEVVAFLSSVRPPEGLRAESGPAEGAAAAGGAQEEGGEEQGGLKLQILARGDIRIGAELSHRHHMCFILGDLTYLMANGRISCQSEELQVHFDQHKIMSLSGGKLSRALNSREVREEREAVPELTLRQNKSWKLTVDTWVFTFPYEYNFAEAFSNDLLSIVKWVKLVHKHKPRPFTAASPLPPDLVIRVRHWQVEVGDDPFEVKLRYNYELLEDEYQEGCKRLKALDGRIEELRKTMFLFPTGKIEELYKNLQEKSSETYIKRSKLMYESAPMRTQLFTWTMEDVVIFALADPIFHGTERVVQHMTNIDPDSPWPEEDQQFSTLWCRMVLASCGEWNFRLRDYPQSLLLMKDVEIWGRLIGAEQKASKRAIRTVNVEVGAPWADVSVERTMSALKFYHDFTCEVKSFTAAYGPCWEPAVSQFNIALSLINQPSRDPSTPLPWWDKMRLLFHGRLTLIVERMTLLLHASLDPYNTTEEMELTWTSLTMDWTNAKVIFKGELNVFVRTASKYDDAKLLHLPNLKLTIKMNWQCQGNPNDHHSVMLCAPDKLPEYSSNQEHDSYRAFRSQNLNMNIVLETKTMKNNNTIITPVIEAMFYGSTLRWFENLKFILSGVTRPTRRGPLFNNTKARKPPLSRHYGTVHLSISFHRFDVRYWMSVGVKKGFHLSGEQLYLSSEHNLTLVPLNDGLKHRPRSCWEVQYLCSELRLAQVWLQSAMQECDVYTSEEQEEEQEELQEPIPPPVEKFYFLNVNKVEYKRETPTPTPTDTMNDPSQHEPTHRLVVHDLKGVWTANNRDIVLALYDSWTKNQQLRRNLTPDIIKNYNPEASTTTQKPRSRSLVENTAQGLASPTSALQVPPVQATPSPITRLQSGHAQAMLQQLIAEADNNQVAYSEDCSKEIERDQVLHGLKACAKDDVIHRRWLIELVDSQVLLKGCESQGYVILSAAKSQIHQQIHRPVWQDHSLVTKTTWVGSLQCMQYYATVSAGDKETQMDNIMWLTMENIMEKDAQVINEIADIVGSGQSVGGVVSQTVGTMDEGDDELQLQRIVSRCNCSFFYVSYGETDLDMSMMEEVQAPLPEDELWNRNVEAVDTFTLAHEDLCASTNSLQYNMVVDILNNLLLYVDPKKKEAMEAVARMRFQLQLYSCEDQRKPIIRLQNQVRYHLSQLRSLEKEVYLVQRQLDKDPNNIQRRMEKKELEEQVSSCKEQVNSLSEELALRIHCYNETQLSSNHKLSAVGGDKQMKVIRMNEVYFRKAQWRLTEADGQLGIADLMLSNFLYTKKTNADDSGEHLLELGYITMRNLLPNQPYQEVLMPSELQANMPVDRQRTLRIYCREKPPCGGISIIEHFEINVVPLNIALTYQFFKTMMKFCFPDNATEEELSDPSTRGSKKQASVRKSHKESNFYVSLQDKDDVEIMKQRAEQNKLFVYIKIPELPVKLSYKGKKEKNLEDVTMVRLVIPTLEYHNVTWTWLDFLMAIKQDSKTALVSQAIRHKLKIAHSRSDDAAAPNEEEKARLLLGNKLMPPKSKTTKKSLFKFNR